GRTLYRAYSNAHSPAETPTPGTLQVSNEYKPSRVHHERPVNVKVRPAAPHVRIKEVQARNGIRERISHKCRGSVIDCLAPGEGALNLKAMAQSFAKRCLKATIG